MTSQVEKVKEIAKEINVISYWNERPKSNSLKRVLSYQRRVLSGKEGEIMKAAERLKYYLYFLANKRDFIENEKDKTQWNEIVQKLEELVTKESH